MFACILLMGRKTRRDEMDEVNSQFSYDNKRNKEKTTVGDHNR